MVNNNFYNIFKTIFLSTAKFFLLVLLFSCKSDIEKIAAYSYIDTLPELLAKDIEYTRSDSGEVKAVLTSSLMYQYSGDEPYFEFPEGFKVIFYDSGVIVSAVMTANYGINFEKKKLMEAQDNVLIINYEKNEQLETERLIWDQRKKKIYSDVSVKITTNDEILYGDGLEADESFSKYEILNPTGVFNIEDDEK